MLTQDNVTTMDVNMLASIVNLKLRDYFASAASMARYYEIDLAVLTHRLQRANFEYDETLNQFL
jgi:hypothetical protein